MTDPEMMAMMAEALRGDRTHRAGWLVTNSEGLAAYEAHLKQSSVGFWENPVCVKSCKSADECDGSCARQSSDVQPYFYPDPRTLGADGHDEDCLARFDDWQYPVDCTCAARKE